jgi:hypothetical protein
MEAPIPLQPFPTPPSGPEPLPTRPGFEPQFEEDRSFARFRGE